MPFLRAVGIRKFFPGVVALDGVDFEVERGEVHALLGENGAGKSTLVSIIYGVYLPDGGEIYIEGKRVEITSPRRAAQMGISLISQHFALVETLTVEENLKLAGVEVKRALEMADMGEVAPNREEREYEPYKGAIVLEPKPGLYSDVLVLDFSSMYPNIMMKYNLSPDTYLEPHGRQDKRDCEGVFR